MSDCPTKILFSIKCKTQLTSYIPKRISLVKLRYFNNSNWGFYSFLNLSARKNCSKIIHSTCIPLLFNFVHWLRIKKHNLEEGVYVTKRKIH